MTTTYDWANGLIEILNQQYALYQQLEGLSQEQGRLVQAGDAEPLLAVLSRRQRLIDRLAEVTGRLEPYKQQWPEMWGRLEASDRQRIGQVVRQVQSVLDQIITQDERDRQALGEQRQRTRQSLQQISRGTSLHRAYTQPAVGPVTNRYTDAQG